MTGPESGSHHLSALGAWRRTGQGHGTDGGEPDREPGGEPVVGPGEERDGAADGAEGEAAGEAGRTWVDAEERWARAALTRIAEPGDDLVGLWVAAYGAEEVVAALGDPGGPMLDGVTEQRWNGLRLKAGRARPDADLAAAEACGSRFICPGDQEWPNQLDDLGTGRPMGLWVRGEASLRFWALRSVAVVGARACTEYGAYIASGLAAGLTEQGWTVVSGAAYGIDAAAHRGALAGRGPTVGVLACGVDVAYPPGHRELIRRLGGQGLLIAELPPGDHPTRSRFILRNRVIAALTRGTVVVEAALRSGSLSTARHAQRLGRHTMGVPGPVTSGLSAGVHQLLRQEGTLVTDAAEIIELVGSIGDLAPQQRAPSVARDLLTGASAKVLEAMPGRGATGAGDLAVTVGMPAEITLTRLHELRALGFVEREGEFWKLTRPGERHSIV